MANTARLRNGSDARSDVRQRLNKPGRRSLGRADARKSRKLTTPTTAAAIPNRSPIILPMTTSSWPERLAQVMERRILGAEIPAVNSVGRQKAFDRGGVSAPTEPLCSSQARSDNPTSLPRMASIRVLDGYTGLRRQLSWLVNSRFPCVISASSLSKEFRCRTVECGNRFRVAVQGIRRAVSDRRARLAVACPCGGRGSCRQLFLRRIARVGVANVKEDTGQNLRPGWDGCRATGTCIRIFATLQPKQQPCCAAQAISSFRYFGQGIVNADPDMASTGKRSRASHAAVMLHEFHDRIPQGLDTKARSSSPRRSRWITSSARQLSRSAIAMYDSPIQRRRPVAGRHVPRQTGIAESRSGTRYPRYCVVHSHSAPRTASGGASASVFVALAARRLHRVPAHYGNGVAGLHPRAIGQTDGLGAWGSVCIRATSTCRTPEMAQGSIALHATNALVSAIACCIKENGAALSSSRRSTSLCATAWPLNPHCPFQLPLEQNSE